MRSDYNPSTLLCLDTVEGEEEEKLREKFRFSELLDGSVLRPFLVSLGLMVLGQFSGQASITFYTAHIFQVQREGTGGKDFSDLFLKINFREKTT